MGWMPRSALDTACGLVWLPRLIDKARRCESAHGARLFDGYCYGNNDFIDKALIGFLKTDDTSISALVREQSSDDEVARILVERSGHSPAECAALSASIRRKFMNFALVEADEGRLPPGFKTNAVKFFYNRIMMPIVYPLFRRDERRRGAQPPS